MNHKKIIHIVDDEIDILDSIKEQLEFLSECEIKIYSNVDQAMDSLTKNPHGILVTDIKMPGKNGIFLLNWIQEKEIKLKAIICMTGYSDYDFETLKQFGVTHFFKKALDYDSFVESIEEIITAF
ncbi:MAG: response regulator [Oligoflexales bacterium]